MFGVNGKVRCAATFLKGQIVMEKYDSNRFSVAFEVRAICLYEVSAIHRKCLQSVY